MPDLKPAYLIHGDDHGAIAERRSRLRALAEAGGGASSVELLEGDAASPESVALALSSMTLALALVQPADVGRVIVVEGAERYRDAQVSQHIAPAMSAMSPDTTIAFFAREDARNKTPASLHEAVRAAGGQIVAELSVKPWQLAGWVREQASRLGLSLDAHAARTLVEQVGERQQRLLRELEKLALHADAGDRPTRLSAEQVQRSSARSSACRGFSLADALIAKDAARALRAYVRLRAQSESLSGLLYLMASRLRESESVASRLSSGESAADVKRTLRMPSRAADRFIADVSRSEPEQLRAALCRLADLELDTRGGAPLSGSRTPLCSLQDDTLAVRAILSMTA